MRHYTFTDLHYWENEQTMLMSATEASSSKEFVFPVRRLLVRNEGPNDVFLAFDKDVATVDGFRLSPLDGLVELRVQAKKISAVCRTVESTTVRITGIY